MAAHKYWRLINIETRGKDANSSQPIGAAEIVFYDANNNDISIGGVATASSGLDSDNRKDPNNAFDKNISTRWINNVADSYINTHPLETWIAYQFTSSVEPVKIGLRMRQDMQDSYLQEWQTADVEYSDDGQTWVKYGKIEPRIAQMDLSLKIVNIIKILVIKGKSLQDNGQASRFVLIHDWRTGDFIKKIIPASDGTWEYISTNTNHLLVTHVGADGFAPQADGGIIPVAS